jgi:uncharacterized membrane protein SirB2
MTPALLKYVHIVCVAASFALFFVRGMWVLRSYPQSQEPWVPVVRHAVDGVLIVSAIGVLFVSPLKGWPGDWLTMKLLLVGIYVALTQVLFLYARRIPVKFSLWILALLTFLFTTTVAVLHNPLGIFAVI